VDERAAEVATLPWELLHWRDVPLCTQVQTLFTRQLLNLEYGGVQAVMIQGKPKVLVVIPRGSGLDTEGERRRIAAPLDKAGVPYRVLDGKTPLPRLADALAADSYHILHFIGHGKAVESAGRLVRGLLRFNSPRDVSNEADDEDWVDQGRIRAFLGPYRDLRLVVLNACQGAAVGGRPPGDSGRGFVGLAPFILRAGVPAVVVMQHPIYDDTAAQFAEAFYSRLTSGRWAGYVDVAVTLARNACYLTYPDDPEFAAPVLFLQAPNGQLFSIATEEREAPALTEESLIVPIMPSATPAPPEPARPPDVRTFVGRQAELAYFAGRLATAHLAVITGMAGSGKTALAAVLARQTASAERVFWHSFHEGEGIDTIIWALAGFLARHGQPDLWQMLGRGRQTGGQLPPLEVLFGYLLQLVRGRGYLLCLDDFHHVESDPLLLNLVARMTPAIERGDVDMIISSRRGPDFINLTYLDRLGGLAPVEVRQLLSAHGLTLADELVSALHASTGGNPQFLTLAIDALQQTGDPERIISRLAGAEDIERYLMTEVDAGLTDDERDVMSAVAVLMGYPGTPDAIEAVLDGRNVRRLLRVLSSRYLLTANDDRGNRQYSQHAIVQAFYYEMLGQRERVERHRRAARYYSDQESDPLKAALHYEAADDIKAAVNAVTADIAALINQGQSQALGRLLQRLAASTGPTGRRAPSGDMAGAGRPALTADQWVALCRARGVVHRLRGEYRQALQSFEDVLQAATNEKVRAEALDLIGRVYEWLGDFDRAMSYYRQSLEIGERVGAHACVANAHLHIGWASYRLGDLEPAQVSFARSQELAQAAADPGIAANAEMGLGVVAWKRYRPEEAQRHWLAEAQRHFEIARRVARQIGDRRMEAYATGNLGLIYRETGDRAQELVSYQQTARIAEAIGDVDSQLTAYNNLGDFYQRTGDYAQAIGYYEQMVRLAENSGHTRSLSTAYAGLADAYLTQKNITRGLDYAERAKATAERIGLGVELGVSWRVLGDAWLALGRPADAREACERAIELLAAAHEDEELAKCQRGLSLARERL
jgi:tetratricopeptide (TPR) repeat protein